MNKIHGKHCRTQFEVAARTTTNNSITEEKDDSGSPGLLPVINSFTGLSERRSPDILRSEALTETPTGRRLPRASD